MIFQISQNLPSYTTLRLLIQNNQSSCSEVDRPNRGYYHKYVLYAYGKNRGFTIVELLIVVVVIAILATISVVAYNGIQSKAQKSLVQSEVQKVSKNIELFRVDNGAYPALINDCPSPTTGSACLKVSDNLEIEYDNAPGVSYAGSVIDKGYNLGLVSENHFLYKGTAERRGINEFLQYIDLAPYMDKYGAKRYKLSFDIKSTDTSNRSLARVYFQNGSGSKHGGLGVDIPVAQEYTYHEVEFTPSIVSGSETQSKLSFYGVYGTGNRPIVKNVRFELVK